MHKCLLIGRSPWHNVKPTFVEQIMNLAMLTQCWKMSANWPLFKVLLSCMEPSTLSPTRYRTTTPVPGENNKRKGHSRGQGYYSSPPTAHSSVYRTVWIKAQMVSISNVSTAYRMEFKCNSKPCVSWSWKISSQYFIPITFHMSTKPDIPCT
jgi:hypothetical protein